MSERSEIADFLTAGFVMMGWGTRRPPIMCALCNKPVDKIQQHDVLNRQVVRFTVQCHGDTDTCELTTRLLEESGDSLQAGYAFTVKRAEDGREHEDHTDNPGQLRGDRQPLRLGQGGESVESEEVRASSAIGQRLLGTDDST